MAFKNVLRQIKAIIYRLKRNFGVAITYVQIDTASQVRTTGALSVTKTETAVRHAIIAPSFSRKIFSYDLSFIAANKNFTYGGLYDVGTRPMILDARDMASDFAPSLDDYIIYDGKKYVIKHFEEAEEKMAYLFVIQRTESVGVPS